MKIRLILTSISILVLLTSMSFINSSGERESMLIGTWKWSTVFDASTGEDMGIDMLTLGMVSDVKTEFKADHTYQESKLKKGSTEYSVLQGEWKLENDEMLSLKSKDKWMPSRITKMNTDSLWLQMNPKMVLLMVKEVK